MKATIINLALAAGLVAAQPQHQHHGHQHLHKREGSPIENRDVQTYVEVVPEYKTAYILGGKEVTAEDAEKGLEDGLYVAIGETTPTFTPPPAPVPTTSSDAGAVFIEQATTTSATPTVAPTPSTVPDTETVGTGTGIDAKFPSGKIPCSHFPSDYGALAVTWMGLSGWSGIQRTPGYSVASKAISFIETAISGDSCNSLGFCSYACPAGYVKTQWPESQGATGQSIGGLLCNADGMLELTRPEFDTLCVAGVGGIAVVNNMSKNVAICRTDYPGTENMVIPLDVLPGGQEFTLANIDTSSYYVWQGNPTTLQYYVNQPGVSVEDACVWDCVQNHDECGNWAPSIIGTGKTAGITYLSIFPNLPTSVAAPKFNLKITGDVTIECGVKDGVYSGSATGCTTGVGSGGAIIEFY